MAACFVCKRELEKGGVTVTPDGRALCPYCARAEAHYQALPVAAPLPAGPQEPPSAERLLGRAIGSMAPRAANKQAGGLDPVGWWVLSSFIMACISMLLLTSSRTREMSDGEGLVLWFSNFIGWSLLIGLIMLIFRALAKK